MESTAWGRPLEFQLTAATNWMSAEEAAAYDAQVWTPAGTGGLPLEYASIVDIFGTSSCSLQPYYYDVVPASSSYRGEGQHQQLAEYSYYNNYAAAALTNAATTQAEELSLQVDDCSQGESETESSVADYIDRPNDLFVDRGEEFTEAAKFVKTKMHRYPPGLEGLGGDDGLYTKPRVVAIGPYHHYGGGHLHKAEKVKHAAARLCIRKYREIVGMSCNPDHLVRDMYHTVVSTAKNINPCDKRSDPEVEVVKARDLYDKDVMKAGEGISDDEFLPMLFYDACFLVMYILYMSSTPCERAVREFIESNEKDIAHDIMLLENQIPWQVVDAVLNKCTLQPLETKTKFIARWKDECLQDQAHDEHKFPPVDWDEDYKPPHLLGLLRFYLVGKGTKRTGSINKVSDSELTKMYSITLSAGAVELAYMGIHLTGNETRELTDMGLASKYVAFAKLSMAPLCLDELRASRLVNMAAFELCTTPVFFNRDEPKFEDTAVCSYLLLLRMLMHREEDVQELRTKEILHGAGFTNKQALDLFAGLDILRKGRYYALVMVEIQSYRNRRWWWLPLYKFIYQNWKYIVGLVSFLSTTITIAKKLWELKVAAHH